MARTLGGTEFAKFDRQSSPETIRQLNGLTSGVEELERTILAHGRALEGFCDGEEDAGAPTVMGRIEGVEASVHALDARTSASLKHVTRQLASLSAVLNLFVRLLNSPLVRFLNLFGRWFVYEREIVEGTEYRYVSLRRGERERVLLCSNPSRRWSRH